MIEQKGMSFKEFRQLSRQRRSVKNIYFSNTGQTALSAPNVEGLDAAICMDTGDMSASTATGKSRLQRGWSCTTPTSR